MSFWIWVIIAGVLFILIVKPGRYLTVRASYSEGADRITELIDATYTEAHEFREIDPSDYAFLDLSFYKRTEDFLRQAGFIHVADIEDVTLSRIHANMRTFIRCMKGGDSDVLAGIYHLKPSGFTGLIMWLGGGRSFKVIDLETEFSDGKIMVATTSPANLALNPPPEILCTHLPGDTSLKEVLLTHKKNVEAYRQANGNPAMTVFHELKDILDFQNRMLACQSRHRKTIPTGITREEMERLSAKGLKETGANVFKELEKRVEQGENKEEPKQE